MKTEILLVNKHVGKSSASPVIKEMPIQISCSILYPLHRGILEIIQYYNTVVKPVPSHTVESHINWYHFLAIHVRNHLKVP